MKKLLLVLSVIFMAGIANAQIVADGSFEAGPGGPWTEYSLNYGTPLCDGGCGNCGGFCGPNTGTFYAWFGGANAVEVGQVLQSIVIPGSSSAVLTMQVYMPTPGPGLAQDRLMISMDGTLLKTITALDSAIYKNGYTQVDINVLAFADGMPHDLIIEGHQSTPTSFNILVDDIDIVAAVTPTSANFSGNPVNVNIGQSVNFTDMSSTNVTGWNWSFPGAATTSSTAQNPTNIVYNTVGCYDVTLDVTSTSGTATETKPCYINVTCPPFGSFFSYSATNLVVNFTNMSVGAESYLWDFGNGSTSIAPNPIWTYTAPGTYTVTLVATDSDCSNTTSTYSINIEVANGQSSGNVSVESLEASGVLVAYPNPTNGVVQLSNIEPNSTYTLVNIEGKVLATGQFTDSEGTIDLTNVQEGVYYLKINGTITKLTKVK